ncbi:ABC transporter substrate-binding protein [Terrihabitans rhizophilus]|uniref:ABC transporter substrate-binding protein n=1 Tax=Terrihabitans rhizophilus TaxID=3092662 RepID=A0ABU4RNJ2_9HYPH|nr:ABC transporter substrate-binding protein [Terrihabitans sp. PJ23]MDX6806171.1 ABC transporter substrate-binding protein [Terrihabitans sp. PJ23]
MLPLFTRRSAVALAAAALLSAASPGAASAQATDVHIGVSNRSLLGLPILIGQKKGFFEKEGLNVTVDYFAGGVPATAALIGGSVQFIDAAFENNIKAVKKGQPIVSILGLQSEFAGALVARTDVVEKLGDKLDASSLKGLRVGTLARGGFADVSTRYIAADAGLDPEKDIELVPIKGADRQLTAGEAGEIDAAFVMEPWNVIAEDSGKWRYVVDLTKGEGPDSFRGIGYTTLQTSSDYLVKNRETADKVVRAVVASLNFITDPANLDETAKLADAEYGSPGIEIMKASLQRQANTFSPVLQPSYLEKTGQLLLKTGSVEAPLPAFRTVVDTSFAPLWEDFKAPAR